ncbi:MAG: glycosyltransferase family 2 protein [Candidatus Levybacteria bacterium]|nr:glycosyltransferase family 2 protein [Candidatus Levybacteria bacterium]
MNLSIVILSYNTLDFVLDAVKSLRERYDKELREKQVEIIVVDNASERRVVEELEESLSNSGGVVLIKSEENLGFGKGCNLGSKRSKGDFILFLNSDTRTLDRGFLEMADYLKINPKTAVLGGRLLNTYGTSQASVGKFYSLANFFIMLFGGEKFGLLRASPNKICQVDWVSGACFMVNKKIFNDLGGFDENMFMYMEDMEFCFRAKKKGYLTFYFPKVSVSHMREGSSNRTFAVVNIYRGILYFYKKHKSKAQYRIVRFFLWFKAMGVYLLGKFTNNSYYTNTYGQALKIFK